MFFKTGMKEKRLKQKKITAFARVGQDVSKSCASIDRAGVSGIKGGGNFSK
jgi:hypothetical protein